MKIHILAMAGLGLIGSTNAAVITGSFNMIGSVRVNATTIDWLPTGGGVGTFRTVDPSTGFFIGISDSIGSLTGTAKDLTNPPTGVGTPVFVGSFLSGFSAAGFSGLFFDLTMIRASTAATCTGAEAVNVSCSAGPSPNAFTLKNTGSGVSVDFAVEGFFQNGADLMSRSFGTGTYTTQLNGETILSVLQQAGSANGFSSAYSASFNAAVPEPGTLAMGFAGLALVGLGIFASRRNA